MNVSVLKDLVIHWALDSNVKVAMTDRKKKGIALELEAQTKGNEFLQFGGLQRRNLEISSFSTAPEKLGRGNQLIVRRWVKTKLIRR